MILAVDLGQKTTGLAISEGTFPRPYKTLRHRSMSEATAQIARICDQLQIETVVIGFVEGKIKSLFENFARDLKKKKPYLEVVMWDETLTTRQAKETMVKLGIAKSRRRAREHQVAAAAILQSYLEAQ